MKLMYRRQNDNYFYTAGEAQNLEEVSEYVQRMNQVMHIKTPVIQVVNMEYNVPEVIWEGEDLPAPKTPQYRWLLKRAENAHQWGETLNQLHLIGGYLTSDIFYVDNDPFPLPDGWTLLEKSPR